MQVMVFSTTLLFLFITHCLCDIKNIESEYGTTVKLNCAVNKKFGRNPSIVWLKEDKIISGARKFTYDVLVNELSSGQYQCRSLDRTIESPLRVFNLIAYDVIDGSNRTYSVKRFTNLIIRPPIDTEYKNPQDLEWRFSNDIIDTMIHSNMKIENGSVKITNFTCSNFGIYRQFVKSTNQVLHLIGIYVRDFITPDSSKQYEFAFTNSLFDLKFGANWSLTLEIVLHDEFGRLLARKNSKNGVVKYTVDSTEKTTFTYQFDTICNKEEYHAPGYSYSVVWRIIVRICDEYKSPNNMIYIYGLSCVGLTSAHKNGEWIGLPEKIISKKVNNTIFIATDMLKTSINVSYVVEDDIETFYLIYDEIQTINIRYMDDSISSANKSEMDPIKSPRNISLKVRAIKHTNITMNCSSSHQSMSYQRFYWTFNSERMETYDSIPFITIQNVSMSDEGIYRCFRIQNSQHDVEYILTVYRPIISSFESQDVDREEKVVLLASNLDGEWKFYSRNITFESQGAVPDVNKLWIEKYSCLNSGIYMYITNDRQHDRQHEIFNLLLRNYIVINQPQHVFVNVAGNVNFSFAFNRNDNVSISLEKAPENSNYIAELNTGSFNIFITEARPWMSGIYNFEVKCSVGAVSNTLFISHQLTVCYAILPNTTLNIAPIKDCLALHVPDANKRKGTWKHPDDSQNQNIFKNILYLERPTSSNVGTYEYSNSGIKYKFVLKDKPVIIVRTFVGDTIELVCNPLATTDLKFVWISEHDRLRLPNHESKILLSINGQHSTITCYSSYNLIQELLTYRIKLYTRIIPVAGDRLVLTRQMPYLIDWSTLQVNISHINITRYILSFNGHEIKDYKMRSKNHKNIIKQNLRLFIEKFACENIGMYTCSIKMSDGMLSPIQSLTLEMESFFSVGHSNEMLIYPGQIKPVNVTVFLNYETPLNISFFNQEHTIVSWKFGNNHSVSYVLNSDDHIRAFRVDCMKPAFNGLTISTSIFRNIREVGCKRADSYVNATGQVNSSSCLILTPIDINSTWYLPKGIEFDVHVKILSGNHLALPSLPIPFELVFYDIFHTMVQFVHIFHDGFFAYSAPFDSSSSDASTIVKTFVGEKIYLSCHVLNSDVQGLSLESSDLKYSWMRNGVYLSDEVSSFISVDVLSSDQDANISCKVHLMNESTFGIPLTKLIERKYQIKVFKHISMAMNEKSLESVCMNCDIVVDARETSTCRYYRNQILGVVSSYRSLPTPIWQFYERPLSRVDLLKNGNLRSIEPCLLWISDFTCQHKGEYTIRMIENYNILGNLENLKSQIDLTVDDVDRRSSNIDDMDILAGEKVKVNLKINCETATYRIQMIGSSDSWFLSQNTNPFETEIDHDIIVKNNYMFRYEVYQFRTTEFWKYEGNWTRELSGYSDSYFSAYGLEMHPYIPLYVKNSMEISLDERINSDIAIVFEDLSDLVKSNQLNAPVRCNWTIPKELQQTKNLVIKTYENRPHVLFIKATSHTPLSSYLGSYTIECDNDYSGTMNVILKSMTAENDSAEDIPSTTTTTTSTASTTTNSTIMESPVLTNTEDSVTVSIISNRDVRCIRNRPCELECTSPNDITSPDGRDTCWSNTNGQSANIHNGHSLTFANILQNDGIYTCHSCSKQNLIFEVVNLTFWDSYLINQKHQMIPVERFTRFVVYLEPTDSQNSDINKKSEVVDLRDWTFSHSSQNIEHATEKLNNGSFPDFEVDHNGFLWFYNFSCPHGGYYRFNLGVQENGMESYYLAQIYIRDFFKTDFNGVKRVVVNEAYKLSIHVNWHQNLNLRLVSDTDVEIISNKTYIDHMMKAEENCGIKSFSVIAQCTVDSTDESQKFISNQSVMNFDVISYNVFNVSDIDPINRIYLNKSDLDDKFLNLLLIVVPTKENLPKNTSWWFKKMDDTSKLNDDVILLSNIIKQTSIRSVHYQMIESGRIVIEKDRIYFTKYSSSLDGEYHWGDAESLQSHIVVYLSYSSANKKEISTDESINTNVNEHQDEVNQIKSVKKSTRSIYLFVSPEIGGSFVQHPSTDDASVVFVPSNTTAEVICECEFEQPVSGLLVASLNSSVHTPESEETHLKTLQEISLKPKNMQGQTIRHDDSPISEGASLMSERKKYSLKSLIKANDDDAMTTYICGVDDFEYKDYDFISLEASNPSLDRSTIAGSLSSGSRQAPTNRSFKVLHVLPAQNTTKIIRRNVTSESIITLRCGNYMERLDGHGFSWYKQKQNYNSQDLEDEFIKTGKSLHVNCSDWNCERTYFCLYNSRKIIVRRYHLVFYETVRPTTTTNVQKYLLHSRLYLNWTSDTDLESTSREPPKERNSWIEDFQCSHTYPFTLKSENSDSKIDSSSLGIKIQLNISISSHITDFEDLSSLSVETDEYTTTLQTPTLTTTTHCAVAGSQKVLVCSIPSGHNVGTELSLLRINKPIANLNLNSDNVLINTTTNNRLTLTIPYVNSSFDGNYQCNLRCQSADITITVSDLILNVYELHNINNNSIVEVDLNSNVLLVPTRKSTDVKLNWILPNNETNVIKLSELHSSSIHKCQASFVQSYPYAISVDRMSELNEGRYIYKENLKDISFEFFYLRLKTSTEVRNPMIAPQTTLKHESQDIPPTIKIMLDDKIVSSDFTFASQIGELKSEDLAQVEPALRHQVVEGEPVKVSCSSEGTKLLSLKIQKLIYVSLNEFTMKTLLHTIYEDPDDGFDDDASSKRSNRLLNLNFILNKSNVSDNGKYFCSAEDEDMKHLSTSFEIMVAPLADTPPPDITSTEDDANIELIQSKLFLIPIQSVFVVPDGGNIEVTCVAVGKNVSSIELVDISGMYPLSLNIQQNIVNATYRSVTYSQSDLVFETNPMKIECTMSEYQQLISSSSSKPIDHLVQQSIVFTVVKDESHVIEDNELDDDDDDDDDNNDD